MVKNKPGYSGQRKRGLWVVGQLPPLSNFSLSGHFLLVALFQNTTYG